MRQGTRLESSVPMKTLDYVKQLEEELDVIVALTLEIAKQETIM
jgi:hypothetical protein